LNSGFVILSVRVDGFFFGDAFDVRVTRLILQLFEQLADAELSGEDLRARLGDLSGGAEFLAAAVMFSRGIRAFGEFRVAGFIARRFYPRSRESMKETIEERMDNRRSSSRSKGYRSPRAFPPVHVVRLDHGELLANHAHLARDAVLGLRELRRRGREVRDRSAVAARTRTNGEPSFVGTRRSVPIRSSLPRRLTGSGRWESPDAVSSNRRRAPC